MLFFLIQHCKVKGARRVLCNTFLVRTLSLFLALSIEKWFLLLCFLELGTHAYEFLESTESGFSALINARLPLGCWSHVKGMSFI